MNIFDGMIKCYKFGVLGKTIVFLGFVFKIFSLMWYWIIAII
jgi:hypothetical protein